MHIKAGGNDVVGKSPFAGAEDPGTTRSLNAGSYDVSESGGPSGYTQTSIGGDCSANGSVTLAVGDEKTCTITNDDISPTLTVNKVLVPANDGGTVQPADRRLTTAGTGDERRQRRDDRCRPG